MKFKGLCLLCICAFLCSCSKKEQVVETSEVITTEALTEKETEKITITQSTEEETTTKEIESDTEVVAELVTEVGQVTNVAGRTYAIMIGDKSIVASVSEDTVAVDNNITVGDMVVISYDRVEVEEDGIPLSNIDKVYALMKVEDPVITTEESVESSEELTDSSVSGEYGTDMENAVNGEESGAGVVPSVDFVVYTGEITELRPNGLVVLIEGKEYFIDTLEAGLNSADYEVGMQVNIESTGVVEEGNPQILTGVLHIYQSY